jgi:hypothetical protein
MDRTSIEIDSRWVKIVRSPVYFFIVALQGISVTFAPLFLYWYWSGKGTILVVLSGSSCHCVLRSFFSSPGSISCSAPRSSGS